MPRLPPARRVTLIGLMALTLPAAASGQDVSVRAFLSPANTVGVGRPFVLNVEITGAQSLTDEPQLPDLGAFALYLGSSRRTSMRVIGGRTSVSLTVEYRFQALVEGSFEIPAFDVVVGGQTRTTEPLQVTVSASPGQGVAGQGQADGTGIGPDDLFVTAEASKTRIHDGEPFVVEYRIWTRVDVGTFTFTRVPEPEGFWVEDITPSGQPQVEQLTRDGQTYTSAVIRRIALVPTGSGERTLEPIGLEAQVRVRRLNDPFADFFGRSSLFGTTVVPTTVLSNSLTFDIEALPPGRPEPFSGVVGRLTISAELDRDSVDANEAITLTVRVEGDGNIGAVPEPDLQLPADFEAFPPEVSESVQPFGPGLSGEKTFEYVIIPRAPGRREIPPVAVSFFDPDGGVYRTVETTPLALTVTGVMADGPVALARGGVAQLRQDIRFIHLGASTLRPTGRVLFTGAWFWIFALVPMVGVAGATALRRHRDLLEGDVAYARGRRASRVAKKRLAAARRLAAADDARAYYAEVARALRGLVADRLNLAEAGLQTSELEARLAREGVAEATVAEVGACLEHCDRQRFAPPVGDSEEKTRFLERAGDLMTALDRAIRP